MILEALKYLNLLVGRLMQNKISAEYGVFQHSATILLWSFTASMIILAGAEWSARKNLDAVTAVTRRVGVRETPTLNNST
jgi:uncharacterized BrkB/YihY/UPF0761 family membrane protein